MGFSGNQGDKIGFGLEKISWKLGGHAICCVMSCGIGITTDDSITHPKLIYLICDVKEKFLKNLCK